VSQKYLWKKKAEMCENMYVRDLYLVWGSGVVCGSTYAWLDGVLSGVLAACEVVCTVRAWSQGRYFVV
jgi:hypothetical protein